MNQHPNGSIHHDDLEKHFMHHEKRSSCPYILPTLFLSLEAIACILCLYVLNMGSNVEDWNKWIVSAIFLYFITGSVRRYSSVVERSRIRCLERHRKRYESVER